MRLVFRTGMLVPAKLVDYISIEKKVNEYTRGKTNNEHCCESEMVLTRALAIKEYKRVNKCKSAQEM